MVNESIYKRNNPTQSRAFEFLLLNLGKGAQLDSNSMALIRFFIIYPDLIRHQFFFFILITPSYPLSPPTYSFQLFVSLFPFLVEGRTLISISTLDRFPYCNWFLIHSFCKCREEGQNKLGGKTSSLWEEDLPAPLLLSSFKTMPKSSSSTRMSLSLSL